MRKTAEYRWINREAPFGNSESNAAGSGNSVKVDTVDGTEGEEKLIVDFACSHLLCNYSVI